VFSLINALVLPVFPGSEQEFVASEQEVGEGYVQAMLWLISATVFFTDTRDLSGMDSTRVLDLNAGGSSEIICVSCLTQLQFLHSV